MAKKKEEKRREKKKIEKGLETEKIKTLSKVKKTSDTSKLSYNMTQGALASVLVGIPTVVAITLIITVGIVAVVAILKDYTIKYKSGDDEVILQRE